MMFARLNHYQLEGHVDDVDDGAIDVLVFEPGIGNGVIIALSPDFSLGIVDNPVSNRHGVAGFFRAHTDDITNTWFNHAGPDDNIPGFDCRIHTLTGSGSDADKWAKE